MVKSRKLERNTLLANRLAAKQLCSAIAEFQLNHPGVSLDVSDLEEVIATYDALLHLITAQEMPE